MGKLTTRVQAIKALCVTALSSTNAEVLIGVDPEELSGEEYPEFVTIIPTSWEYEPNTLLNSGISQEGYCYYSIYVGVGHVGAGTKAAQQNALERADVLLSLLVTGLLNERPDSTSAELQLRERNAFHGWRGTGMGKGVVYRMDWAHYAYEQV